jgi:membrane-associated phospholipid phosphatase
MTPRQKKFALIAAAFGGFIAFEALLFFFADRPLAEYVYRLSASRPDVIDFFRNLTDLGKSSWYLWPCGFATLFCGFISRGKDVPPRWRRLCAYTGVRALFLFMTIALSGIVADIIKPIAGRLRPILWLRDQAYGFAPFHTDSLWNSFPSGHTTTAFALAFSLSTLYPRGRILWFAYALLLASSRVMVDAHYLSDVCAGAALGWLTVHLFMAHGMIQVWKVIFPIDKPLTQS